MKRFRFPAKQIDFEEVGFKTGLETMDKEHAIEQCALHIHAYADRLKPELGRLNASINDQRRHAVALHAQLYDRAIPVSDAAMLSRSRYIQMLTLFIVLVACACLAGNGYTFYLQGSGALLTLILALAFTGFPLVVGHFAYERILSRTKLAQVLVIVSALALCSGGILRLALARRDMVERTDATTAPNSYVDNGQEDTPISQATSVQGDSEAKVRRGVGEAMLMIMMASELMLGFLVGLLTTMLTDQDYAAWRHLKKCKEFIIELEERVAELIASIEIAKKRCMAGILRAQNIWSKRRPPYHQVAALALVLLGGIRSSQAQTVERYEGILIDSSGSIARGGGRNDLYREYLIATKKLLLTEPANSRVWVSIIASDSFGGAEEVLKGWTPDAHGVFTDELNRARYELAKRFEVKSSGMSPVAGETDIFGGLWHLKAFFESSPKGDASIPKTIWIFSDMVNETKGFRMPALTTMGSAQMLERAKANGMLVLLKGYKIHVCGASSSGLTPHAWLETKAFWTAYFSAAGADLVTYSVDCDQHRN